MKNILYLSALGILMLLAACGGGASANTAPTNAPTPVAANTSVPVAAATDQPTAAPAQAASAPTDSAAAAPTAASATAAPDATGVDPTRVYAAGADPQTVVQNFFAAVNAKQNDAALALVDDSVFFGLGDVHGTSKADVGTFLSKNTLTYTIADIQFEHTTDSLTMQLKQSDGKLLHGAVSVEDGKITFMALGALPQ